MEYHIDPYATTISYAMEATREDIEWHASVLEQELGLYPDEASRLSELGAAALHDDAMQLEQEHRCTLRTLAEVVMIRSNVLQRELPKAPPLLIIGAVATAYEHMFEERQKQQESE